MCAPPPPPPYKTPGSATDRHSTMHTVNVEIFALYIFPLNSRFLNIRENIYTVKITIRIAQRVICTKNANFNPREITHFHKSAKIYTRENIYVYLYLRFKESVNPLTYSSGDDLLPLGGRLEALTVLSHHPHLVRGARV